jgi:hypothetical protein
MHLSFPRWTKCHVQSSQPAPCTWGGGVQTPACYSWPLPFHAGHLWDSQDGVNDRLLVSLCSLSSPVPLSLIATSFFPRLPGLKIDSYGGLSIILLLDFSGQTLPLYKSLVQVLAQICRGHLDLERTHNGPWSFALSLALIIALSWVSHQISAVVCHLLCTDTSPCLSFCPNTWSKAVFCLTSLFVVMNSGSCLREK